MADPVYSHSQDTKIMSIRYSKLTPSSKGHVYVLCHSKTQGSVRHPRCSCFVKITLAMFSIKKLLLLRLMYFYRSAVYASPSHIRRAHLFLSDAFVSFHKNTA